MDDEDNQEHGIEIFMQRRHLIFTYEDDGLHIRKIFSDNSRFYLSDAGKYNKWDNIETYLAREHIKFENLTLPVICQSSQVFIKQPPLQSAYHRCTNISQSALLFIKEQENNL